MNRKLLLGTAIFIISAGTIAVSVYSVLSTCTRFIAVANLIIISITVIVLLIYAYDTHTIATVSQKQWERSSILGTTYEMEAIQAELGDVHTLFRIHNPSTLLVKAKVRCNLRVYDEPIDCSPDYNGKNTWYVFPQQINHGWFALNELLTKKGKTVQNMRTEMTPENRSHQLTIDLEIYFCDEEDNKRSLPSRRHFFDFAESRWIPQLTQKDEWKID